MITYNTGSSNGRWKGGVQTGNGHRLASWIPLDLWQEMKAQAEAQGVTVTDFVIAAIEAALREESVG